MSPGWRYREGFSCTTPGWDSRYPIAKQYVDHVVLVPDDAINRAQLVLWETLRVVTEPGGAAAFNGHQNPYQTMLAFRGPISASPACPMTSSLGHRRNAE
jgi:hypothetical protein